LHRKVLDAIVRCRTAVLGGHRDQCLSCGHQAISYNSCLMVSNSLWRVGGERACSKRSFTPIRLSISVWPLGVRSACPEAETYPFEGVVEPPPRWPPASWWDRRERRSPWLPDCYALTAELPFGCPALPGSTTMAQVCLRTWGEICLPSKAINVWSAETYS
jgi:hypothetical protein